MAKLKDCPFCGGKAGMFKHSCGADIKVFAKCLICDCQTKEITLCDYGTDFEQLKEKVKSIWDRRATNETD